MLPSVWFGFSFLFFVGLIYWSLALKAAWVHKQHIHLLMTLLVTLKVLTMFGEGLYHRRIFLSPICAAL